MYDPVDTDPKPTEKKDPDKDPKKSFQIHNTALIS